MKSIFKIGLSLILIAFSTQIFAQKKDKKVIEFSVERIINAPVEDVWRVVGEDFGAIANSHPKIVSSEYNQGHITGGVNASRRCNFNEEGTKYLEEKQIEFDAVNHTFKVKIYHTDGIPLNTDYTYGIYKVEKISEKQSKLKMTMILRTKPAFLGWIAKGQFKKDIADYLLAVEHHVLTGEIVNKENFKEIKKKYKG
ncbi:SRPBCC family protein [Aureivirga sp. CE67]|uniref:SRPBCC family protein n=1 Tax=Aureivirga sp. CE67 TaxID=1788983 RepID=UPI0018CBEA07|nr:SRPBCC family protein [Aureivirga sp. CE67]